MPVDSTPVPSSPSSARPTSVPAPAEQPEILTGSGAILRSLEHLGVKDVFGLPGGAIIPDRKSVV